MLGLAVSLLIVPRSFAAQDDPFAAFKLLGERTECVVERLARSSPSGSNSGEDDTDSKQQFAQLEVGELLSDAEARWAYDCAREDIAAAYQRARLSEFDRYQAWSIFSSSAYLSETHGGRYVNNYANAVAAEGYADTDSEQPI